MYAFIRGTLVHASPTFATIDVSGVGYQIHIPSSAFAKLNIGFQVQLHTSFIVREGFQGLYGFCEADERDLFNEIIEISGIGPKIALCLIGHLSLTELHEVIVNEDAAALCKVPGIGKKTAERLLIELRNKLEGFFLKLPVEKTASVTVEKQNFQDALKALVHLGYNPSAAQKAIKKALDGKQELGLGELISSSLKHF